MHGGLIVSEDVIKERTYREDPFAVAAFEAGLVVDDAVRREEVDEMDRLFARRALVLRAGERHVVGDVRRRRRRRPGTYVALRARLASPYFQSLPLRGGDR